MFMMHSCCCGCGGEVLCFLGQREVCCILMPLINPNGPKPSHQGPNTKVDTTKNKNYLFSHPALFSITLLHFKNVN